MTDRLRELSRHLPLRVLVPLGLLLALLWGFTNLADEVGEADTRWADEWVLRQLRTEDLADPIGPGWFEQSARDLTALGSYPVLILVVTALAGYLSLRGNLRLAAVVVGSSATGFGASLLLKLGFDRPRPELVPHEAEVLTSSFPSGHSMAAALIWPALAALLARADRRSSRGVQVYLMGVALAVTGIVGVSRVYLGVHYPTDVLGGWALGAAWAVATWWVAEEIDRRARPG
jgi:undecaprenyl-diphosphatase